MKVLCRRGKEILIPGLKPNLLTGQKEAYLFKGEASHPDNLIPRSMAPQNGYEALRQFELIGQEVYRGIVGLAMFGWLGDSDSQYVSLITHHHIG